MAEKEKVSGKALKRIFSYNISLRHFIYWNNDKFLSPFFISSSHCH